MQNRLKNKLEFQRPLFIIIHYHTNAIQIKHRKRTNIQEAQTNSDNNFDAIAIRYENQFVVFTNYSRIYPYKRV